MNLHHCSQLGYCCWLVPNHRRDLGLQHVLLPTLPKQLAPQLPAPGILFAAVQVHSPTHFTLLAGVAGIGEGKDNFFVEVAPEGG